MVFVETALFMRSIFFIFCLSVLFIAGFTQVSHAQDQITQTGNARRGNVFFQQNCVICHATSLGFGNTVIVKQGPSLVGVVGRQAGTNPGFTYTKALSESGRTWDEY